jgi:predicted AAA+ superfamily ATPase
LIILDEIQELKNGLTALKYFCEQAPQHHVAVAGSLLGITMHHGESAPVGKVDILNLYPLTYTEFLQALGQEQLVQVLKSNDWKTIQMLKYDFIKYLRIYYFVGGMPESVLKYIETRDTMSVREVQNNILAIYRSDMSKHATPQEVVRITQVWQSIPSQLARENKKFIYGAMKKGSRAAAFEVAIEWLKDAGLLYKVSRTKEVRSPLKFYEDFDAFKLFILDVGLMGAMVGADAGAVLVGNGIFSEYKGAFTELFVCVPVFV